jgi:hypothetical protein
MLNQVTLSQVTFSQVKPSQMMTGIRAQLLSSRHARAVKKEEPLVAAGGPHRRSHLQKSHNRRAALQRRVRPKKRRC